MALSLVGARAHFHHAEQLIYPMTSLQRSSQEPSGPLYKVHSKSAHRGNPHPPGGDPRHRKRGSDAGGIAAQAWRQGDLTCLVNILIFQVLDT